MMEDQFGQSVTVLRYESVGPTIGQEVTSRAAIAVAIAAIGVLIYIVFAFRGIQNALRYGICGIIAMLHDVLIVISLAAIGGVLWGWQVDSIVPDCAANCYRLFGAGQDCGLRSDSREQHDLPTLALRDAASIIPSCKRFKDRLTPN